MVEASVWRDQVLMDGIQGISDLIAVPNLINLDFADVKSIMLDEDCSFGHWTCDEVNCASTQQRRR